jgi:hypothetical protein
VRSFLNETHKTPKFHGGNVSATQFLDSFRIYLWIRSVKERCTIIVRTEIEKMGSARTSIYLQRKPRVNALGMIYFVAKQRVEEGFAGWLLTAATGLDRDKDRVNLG